MIEFPRQIVVSDHISLHALEDNDAAKLFRLTDRNRARLKQWLPWVEDTKTADDTLRFIQKSQEDFEQKKSLAMGIRLRGQLTGVIGVHHIDWVNLKTGIGYWIGAEFSGRGIVVMSCRALIDFLVRDLKLNRIEIHAAVGNTKSHHIAKKLGFTQEGILRQNEKLYDQFMDHVCFSVLAKEWRQQ